MSARYTAACSATCNNGEQQEYRLIKQIRREGRRRRALELSNFLLTYKFAVTAAKSRASARWAPTWALMELFWTNESSNGGYTTPPARLPTPPTHPATSWPLPQPMGDCLLWEIHFGVS
ncbi:hypothetical protein J6590_069243 [Homalodisca vitripennis]|nr:hypothetical protein J6590_069243 [Homalodisca vitripennis]